MTKITSRDNPKIKLARKVRDGRVSEMVFVEGVRLAGEALRSNFQPVEILVSDSLKNRPEFLQNLPFIEVSSKIFDFTADTQNSQGIILIGRKPLTDRSSFEANLQRKKSKLPLIVMLVRINNPSNLGAILRTVEAVDAHGVIVSKDSADAFSPKSVRASMGAVFRLNLWTNANFFEAIEWSKNTGLTATSADIRANRSYLEINWQKPRLLIFGSEARGLDENQRNLIDESLLIPMENEVESLNLAVSCAIVLFEAKRQIEFNQLA